MPLDNDSDNDTTPELTNTPKKPELIPDEKTGRLWKPSSAGGGYGRTSKGKKSGGRTPGGNGHDN